MARNTVNSGRQNREPKSEINQPHPRGTAKRKSRKSTVPGTTKIPRYRKPEGMSLEAWQIALRREFGRAQNFLMENIGVEPIFSEFLITNPESQGQYRVAIRGQKPGDNYCSCPDFAVNALGTCKHIEFTLAKLEARRGAKAALEKGFHPSYSEVYLRYGGRREVIFQPGTGCPKRLMALASRYFDRHGVLKPESFARVDAFMKDTGRDGHEVRCYEDAIQFVAQVRDQARLEAAIASLAEQKETMAGLLKVSLYPYQQRGALFAARAGRAIIADDMGLGKTVQAIAASEILARTMGIEKVLIVCPTSLKHQWKEEIKRFTDRTAQVVEGPQAWRAAAYQSESFYKITNYDVVHRDREPILKWSPDLIILDEAQRIKNWRTRTARAVKKLDSPYAMVLTGTPLENRLEELHSIVEFVDRFRLGPLFRFLAEHQLTDGAGGSGKIVGYQNLSRIAQTLAPILIRRGKSEVLHELPARIENKFFVAMTREQRLHHEENAEIVARIAAKWRRYHYLSETDQRRLMIALQNMRMSCNSTYLLDHHTDFGQKTDELMTLLGEMFEHQKAKAVVFSQWTRTHELIIRRLERRGWGYVYFHGGVPGPKRKDLIAEFKKNPDCRLFLSTDSGGVGLNLQAATAVINMDLPWNPAILEQRIGRVHRLGQSQPVQVVNFIASDTIEHAMLSVLAFKKSVFAGVLEGGQDEVFLGESELNKFMESVETLTSAITPAGPVDDEPTDDEPAKDLAEDGPTVEVQDDMEEPVTQPSMPPARAWAGVAAAGLTFLDQLGQALGLPKKPSEVLTPDVLSTMINRDKEGQTFLKVPLPKPDVLGKAFDLIKELLGRK